MDTQLILESKIGQRLISKGMTLATAESCSGGLISHKLTNVPGASGYFCGGVVTYSNEVKEKILGVDENSINDYGAVSEEVARQMADGVRRKFGSDIGVSVTGIAGPSGGTDEKPVGLVYIALSSEHHMIVTRENFAGTREEIKLKTAEKALSMLWEYLQ